MTQKSKLYFTVPTGRQSPPFTPTVSSPMRRRKPSHATIRHPRRRTNPFKLSLNLTVKVQPMDDGREQRFSLNKSFGPEDGVFDFESSGADKTPINVQQQQYDSVVGIYPTSTSGSGGTEEPTFRRSNGSNARDEVLGAESSDSRSSHASSRSSQRSLKDKRKIQTTGNHRYKNKRSSLKKPRSKSLTKIPGFVPYPRPKRLSFNDSTAVPDDEVVGNESMKSDADKTFPLDKSFPNSLGLDDSLPLRSHSVESRKNGDAEVRPSDSRSSQRLSMDMKETSGDRQNKNNESACDSPRHSETSLDDDLPCRLSFNESNVEPREMDAVEAKSSDSRSSHASQGSLKNKKKMVQSTGNRRYKNKRSLLSFASLRKPRGKSLATPRRRLSFNDSVARNEFQGAESSDSNTSQVSVNEKKIQTPENCRYKNKRSLLSFSSLKNPQSNTLGTSVRFNSTTSPSPLSFNQSALSDDVFEVDASGNTSLGRNDNIASLLNFNDSVAPVEVDAGGSKTPKIYYHQRSFRVGFIGNNGVQAAVNCIVNIRSDQEVLYVEPCELLFEGEKIWSRSVRLVTEEIQAKLAADKKNQI